MDEMEGMFCYKDHGIMLVLAELIYGCRDLVVLQSQR